MDDALVNVEHAQPDMAWRIFVAITIPAEVKASIESAQAELKRAVSASVVRWTGPGQLHLTLKFLGNLEVSRVDVFREKLRAAVHSIRSLTLRAVGIGFFPGRGLPRVIWVGVDDAGGGLAMVQAAVEKAAAGFTAEPAEERFVGHVTIGRVKLIRRPEADALTSIKTSLTGRIFGEWSVNTVEIIRSEMLSTGSRYTSVGEASLAGGS